MEDQKPMGMGLLYANVAARIARDERDAFARQLLNGLLYVAIMDRAYSMILALL